MQLITKRRALAKWPLTPRFPPFRLRFTCSKAAASIASIARLQSASPMIAANSPFCARPVHDQPGQVGLRQRRLPTRDARGT